MFIYNLLHLLENQVLLIELLDLGIGRIPHTKFKKAKLMSFHYFLGEFSISLLLLNTYFIIQAVQILFQWMKDMTINRETEKKNDDIFVIWSFIHIFFFNISIVFNALNYNIFPYKELFPIKMYFSFIQQKNYSVLILSEMSNVYPFSMINVLLLGHKEEDNSHTHARMPKMFLKVYRI